MAYPGTFETRPKPCSFANVRPIAFHPAEAEEESVTALAKANVGPFLYYRWISQKADNEPEEGGNKNRQKASRKKILFIFGAWLIVSVNGDAVKE